VVRDRRALSVVLPVSLDRHLVSLGSSGPRDQKHYRSDKQEQDEGETTTERCPLADLCSPSCLDARALLGFASLARTRPCCTLRGHA
jgi:hypothetical protein